MSYAEGTSVPISQSQNEIRKILDKYEATGFAFGEQGQQAVVMFEMQSRRIRFVLPMPDPNESRFTHINSKSNIRTNKEVRTRRYEQAQKQKWRALALAIKAKLECVESGITTLEEEFLAHIMLPNGSSVGQVMIPQIDRSYSDGKMPPLLGYSG